MPRDPRNTCAMPARGEVPKARISALLPVWRRRAPDPTRYHDHLQRDVRTDNPVGAQPASISPACDSHAARIESSA